MAPGSLWLFNPIRHSSSVRHLLRFAAALVTMCLGAGAGAQTVLPDYLIGPGDVLEVIVRGEPELSATVPVRPDGRATFPLVEDLPVSGSTPAAVRLELERRLAKYLRSPQVTVIVREAVGLPSQQIRVVGQVVTPRAIPYRSGITLLDVMRDVGQLSPFAAGNRAVVVREVHGEVERIRVRLDDLLKDGDDSANMTMQPGDVLLIPEGYWSGESRLTWGFGLTGEFSDNIDLDPSGDEESAYVTRVTPSLTWRANLAGFNGGLDARVENRHTSDGTDRGWSVRPRVIGNGTAKLLSDRLFVDASATLDKEVSSTRSRGAEADQGLTQRYLISPYLRNRFGRTAVSELRYTFNMVKTDEDRGDGDPRADALNNTRANSLLFLLGSGRRFTELVWGFEGFISDEDREAGGGAERRRVAANAGYPIRRSLAVVGLLGHEKLDDIGVDVSDETWQIGVEWQPSRRTEIKLGYGSRLGIESPALSYRQDLAPQTRVTATYSETVETGLERTFTDLERIGIDRETQSFVDDFTLLPFRTNTTGFGLSAETTRTKRFRATLSAIRRRNTLGLSLLVGEQRGAVTRETEENEELTATWTRLLSSRTSVDFLGSAEERDFSLTDRRDRTYRVRARLRRTFGRDLTGNLSYQFRKRTSTLSGAEYTENRIILGIQVQF